MLVEKKYFWLLSAIPLYALYMYVSHVFYEKQILWHNLICLSAFMLSAVLLLVVSNRIIGTIPAVLLTGALLSVALLAPDKTGMQFQQFFIYCIFYVPALLIVGVSEHKNKSGKKNKAEKKAKTKEVRQDAFSSKTMGVDFLMIAMPIIIALILKSQGESFEFTMDATGNALVLSFIAVVICACVLYRKRETLDVYTVLRMRMLFIFSLSALILHLSWAHNYEPDILYVLFPLFFSMLLILDSVYKFSEK